MGQGQISPFSGDEVKWVFSRIPRWKWAVKRNFDFFISLLLLFFTFPLFVLIAACIKLTSRGSVFFTQERTGYLGVGFQIYKFRTMVAHAPESGGYETWQKDPRITKVGDILRRWALDELPQLWNVAKGEMSLVGPRPTLAYQVRSYSNRQRKRLLVKPGLTGLAQVKGRNNLNWSERIELDVQYIENYSLIQDIKILFETLGLILSQKGVYGDTGV